MITIPAGITWDTGTNAYWVRADYYLKRCARGWELTDCIDGDDRFFRTEAAGLAVLAALI